MNIKSQGVRFQGGYIKVGNLGVLYKTELEGDPETFTFGFMQLFDKTQPRGLTGLSKAPKRGPIPGLLNKSWEFWGLV